MVRHPTARRARRQDTSPDDAFVEGVLETTVWARKHQTALMVGGIAVVVLVAGLFWYRSMRAQRTERATAELSQVRQTLLSGNAALAAQDLTRYLDAYGGEPVAQEARLLLAQAQLMQDDAESAITTIRPLAADLDRPLGAQAAFLLASAYEVRGQTDQAQQTYLRIADDAPFEHQQLRALDAAGRLRTSANDPAGAAEVYQRAVDMLEEGNPQRAVFELRLAEARAAAGRTAQPPTAATTGS